ncbi:MAG: serine--tRNA ligase [Patescibacteria group bacterium]|nr:serine--tRNA ligase [Patescibacteria group bacterium]
MLSIDFIKNNKQKVLEAAKNKNRQVEIEKIIKLDEEKRKLNLQIQKLREKRNLLAKNKPTSQIIAEGKKIKKEIKELEKKLKEIEDNLNNLLSFVPNVPLPEVPVGKDASFNKVVKTWGKIPQFDFPVKSHIDLGKSLDIIDFERGSKVSGFRGYFLKNELAILHFALLFYVFQKLVKKGYTPIIAPAIVKKMALFGCGQFPWGKQDTYILNDEDAYLAGTAEQPVTSYFTGKVLKEEELPKKFVAFSACFRKEAGSYGKDTKGLYRLHEFFKVEQVIIAKNDLKEARKLHEELQRNSEEILEELELPYRRVILSTGEMGEPQIFKYDTEVWMPYRNDYGEAMSNSIMGDFQARRLNIKYQKKDRVKEYCYTLNNTAIASPRILIAILENYQQKDGTVIIPKILQPILGFKKISPKNQ